jgi:hypothetical protein
VGFLADQGDRPDMTSRPQRFSRAASRLSGSNDHDACLCKVHRVRSLAALPKPAAVMALSKDALTPN